MIQRDPNFHWRWTFHGHHGSFAIVVWIVEVVDLRDDDIRCEDLECNFSLAVFDEFETVFARPEVFDLVIAIHKIRRGVRQYGPVFEKAVAVIPSSEITMVRLGSSRLLFDEVPDPFRFGVARQMVPASVLGCPEAGKRFAASQVEIHGMAGLEPAIVVVNPAVLVDVENPGFVRVFWKKRRNSRWRIDPKVAIALRFVETGYNPVRPHEHAAHIDVEIMPGIVVPDLGGAMVPGLEAEGAPLCKTDALEDAVRDRAEDAAVGHIVRVQDLQRIAHRRVFIKRVGSFEDFIEMIQARLIVAKVLPDGERQFIAGFVLPLVKLSEAFKIGCICNVVAGQPDARYAGGRCRRHDQTENNCSDKRYI